MRLKLIHGKILVTNFLRNARTGKMLAAEAGGVIRVGDRVVAVAGKRLQGTTFKDAITMIMKGGRPLELSFRRGPGDSTGSITCDRSTAGNFFDNIFSSKKNSNDNKPQNQIARKDSLHVHKSNLARSHHQHSPATSHKTAGMSRSPKTPPTTRDGRPVKSCLKSPDSGPSPKKSVRFSDEAGRSLEEVWFADNTHYSTSKQKRLGIYSPRMDDPCVVS